jgi:hypothetical protein
MGLMYFEYLPILDAVMISYYLPYVFLNNYFKNTPCQFDCTVDCLQLF